MNIELIELNLHEFNEFSSGKRQYSISYQYPGDRAFKLNLGKQMTASEFISQGLEGVFVKNPFNQNEVIFVEIENEEQVENGYDVNFSQIVRHLEGITLKENTDNKDKDHITHSIYYLRQISCFYYFS